MTETSPNYSRATYQCKLRQHQLDTEQVAKLCGPYIPVAAQGNLCRASKLAVNVVQEHEKLESATSTIMMPEGGNIGAGAITLLRNRTI